jgi:hypothetical protein
MNAHTAYTGASNSSISNTVGFRSASIRTAHITTLAAYSKPSLPGAD